MSNMTAWDVFSCKEYEGALHIDTVFFIASMTAAEVRRSLIDHDGFDSDIEVVRSKQ